MGRITVVKSATLMVFFVLLANTGVLTPQVATAQTVTPQVPVVITTQGIINDIPMLVNNYRKEQGLLPLTPVSSLNRAAFAKAEQLVVNERFVHRDQVIGGVEYFTNRAGYRLHNYRLLGENLACGAFTNPNQVAKAWIVSEMHRKTILTPTFSEYGIGFARGNVKYGKCDKANDLVVVMTFGGITKVGTGT